MVQFQLLFVWLALSFGAGEHQPRPPSTTTDNTVLSSMLGPTPGKELFFRDFWQIKPAVIRRHNPTFFQPIMRQSDLDAILVQSSTASMLRGLSSSEPKCDQAEHDAESKSWTLVKRIKGVDGEWWSSTPATAALRQIFGLDDDSTDAEVAHAAFSRGYSLVINNIEDKLYGTSRLALAFEGELGYRTSINCYFTPPGSQAFEAHFDWMDAFILQVEGSKRWRLYDALVEQPRPDMQFKPSLHDIGEPYIDFVLEPGDLLYLPSGTIHEALNENDGGLENSSLHLTVGIETTVLGSWESLLLEVLTVLSGGSAEDRDVHSAWSNVSALQCSRGPAGENAIDDSPNLPFESVSQVFSSVVTPKIEDCNGATLRQGDLIALVLMQVAMQERALRRPVPLKHLMKRNGKYKRLTHLTDVVSLLKEQGDVRGAWDAFIRERKSVPRNLVVFGKSDSKDRQAHGEEMKNRLLGAAAAWSDIEIPDEIQDDFLKALDCLQGALSDSVQTKAIFSHFEHVCQRDLVQRQEQRELLLEAGVWQADINAVDGKLQASQIYGVGSQTPTDSSRQ